MQASDMQFIINVATGILVAYAIKGIYYWALRKFKVNVIPFFKKIRKSRFYVYKQTLGNDVLLAYGVGISIKMETYDPLVINHKSVYYVDVLPFFRIKAKTKWVNNSRYLVTEDPLEGLISIQYTYYVLWFKVATKTRYFKEQSYTTTAT